MQRTLSQKIALCIDDDWEDRELIREAIHRCNSNVIVKEMSDGYSGVSYLQDAKNFSNLPCVILLDLNMPEMDGRQVLKEIKKDKDLAAIPVVIFTTSNNELDKAFAESQGAEFITKSLTFQQLDHSIEKILSHC